MEPDTYIKLSPKFKKMSISELREKINSGEYDKEHANKEVAMRVLEQKIDERNESAIKYAKLLNRATWLLLISNLIYLIILAFFKD